MKLADLTGAQVSFWVTHNLGAFQGLLLWSILRDRFDLVKYLLVKSRMSIPTSLAIASICETIKEKTAPDTDTKSDYKDYHNEYENYAVEIFSKLWDSNWESTEKILGWPQKEWANMTALDFAEVASAHKFLALPGSAPIFIFKPFYKFDTGN